VTAPSTAERLGYPADARLLIVNGDDLGAFHAANVATVAGLADGILTSSSLMVPCAWAVEGVRMAAGFDVGVHLTINAEYPTYRWGPLTAAGRDSKNGLIDDAGYYWNRVAPIAERGSAAAARAEAVAQIDWALARGVDVTGLDNHMGVYVARPDLLAVYVDLAREYRLPLRLRPASRYRAQGQPEMAALVDAARVDVLAPDEVLALPLDQPERLESFMLDVIANLKPGVTEFLLHAAAPGEELTAVTPDAPARAEAARLVTDCAAVREAIRREGIELIGYRELRDAQRAGA
jgi:chitin disaccharide deacetylase